MVVFFGTLTCPVQVIVNHQEEVFVTLVTILMDSVQDGECLLHLGGAIQIAMQHSAVVVIMQAQTELLFITMMAIPLQYINYFYI